MKTSSNIRTYDDLVRERMRLEGLFEVQKAQVREDIREIQESLKPARLAAQTIGKFFHRDHRHPLLTSGLNILIDMFVKYGALKRASWLARIIVPNLLKNYSSHLFSGGGDDSKPGLFKRIASLFSKNGHSKHTEEEVKGTGDV